MPIRVGDMHPFASQTVAELLRDLGVKLTQAADVLSNVPSIPAMQSLDSLLLESLALLRRHINCQKSSIYRLHPELLSAAASHLERESDLVRATHVSYHWRDTLHSNPSLWAHLGFEHIGRALAFLERSKSVPLYVNLTGNGRTPPSVGPLLPHATRIVALGLVDRPDQKKLLSQPMPSLRRLEISDDFYDEDDDSEDNDSENDDEDDDDDDDDDDPPNTPVDKTVSRSLPSVISLAVHNIYPIPFHVPNLTCFKFRYLHPMDDEAILESLLDFLHHCPLLEVLEVSYPEDSISTDDRVISLPNLHSYTQNMLPGRGVYSLGVFHVLSLPIPCTVTLRSWTDSDAGLGAANIIPPLKNPRYLAGVRRVKLSMALSGSNSSVLGTLQLINDQGSRVCLEREMYVSVTYQRTSVQDLMDDSLKFGLLSCLKDLDTPSIEILCIEADESWDDEAPAVDAVKEVPGRLGGVKTLVLSHAAVKPCLLALERDAGTENGQGFPQVQTLVVHSRSSHDPSGIDVLRALLPVARRRKAASHPFKSVSVFLEDTTKLGGRKGEGEELVELRRCIEKFRLATGDDVLDWDIDGYFLDGLGHLRNHRNVQWELDDDEYYGFA